MALTPPEIRRFLTKNNNADRQADNAIDQMTALLDYLSAHCCQGQSSAAKAARPRRATC